jgi:16S rRNA (cytidine1402-2'-O)-methyltransferase
MTLYLLPNLLDDTLDDHQPFLPANIGEIIAKLDGCICETEKPARRFLGRFKRASLTLRVLNEHTKDDELAAIIEPLVRGETWGVISDAGLPCIADPGSKLVSLARKKGVRLEAVVGPSSIFMALMLSGFSGQHFTFHGYLPREKEPKKAKIRLLEQKSRKEKSTEIFIEAPYRNQELLQDLVSELAPHSWLAVACDLTAPTQEVHVKSVAEWKKMAASLPQINKRPTVFLLYAM